MMKITNRLDAFLEGMQYSAEIKFPLGKRRDHAVPDRFNFLKQCVAGKKIIHLGCCDHISCIERNHQNHQWLQDWLSESAQQCLGVDIGEDTVKFVNEKLGISNVICCDLTDSVPEIISSQHWDYLVLPEVIEHIDNPVDFMQKLNHNLAPFVGKLIITAPNAFTRSLKPSFRNIEYINSDHRYWFSPYTLSRLLSIAGFSPTEFFFIDGLPLYHEISITTPVASAKKILSILRRIVGPPRTRACLAVIADFNIAVETVRQTYQ